MNMIDPQQVARIKRKLKQPETKAQVKSILQQLSSKDLQQSHTVKHFILKLSRLLNERFPPGQIDVLTRWILAQHIDPKNKWHLLKLWSMFR